MTARRWALAVLAGAGFVLAACGGSGTPATTTTTTHHRAVTSTTVSTTTTTVAPTSTTTSSTAAPAACSIKGAQGQGQGAAGTITGTVIVTNVSAAACTVNGYPTLHLYSGTLAPLTVTQVNGLTVHVSQAANAPPSSVTLAANGGTAQFAYQYSDVPSGSETTCPQSEAASVTLPDGGVSSPTFQLSLQPCDNGTVYVSPLYAAS